MRIVQKRWPFGAPARLTEAEKRDRAGPASLPDPRPQALTPPLSPAGADDDDVREASSLWWWLPTVRGAAPPVVRQATHQQRQSALLAWLPVEVRRLIWSHVAGGGRLLHIVRLPGRLMAIECVEQVTPERATGHHPCWGYHRSLRTPRLAGFYRGPLPQHPAQPVGFTALLQTCRIIYGEVVDVIYSENIFDVNHLDTLLYLQRSILSHRLAQVSSLNMTWDFVYSPTGGPSDPWTQSCRVLAGLELKELTLHLLGASPTRMIRGGRWGAPFEQLMEIKTPQRFHVFVSWSETSWVEFRAQFLPDEEEGLPFRVVTEPEERPLVWKRINEGPLQI